MAPLTQSVDLWALAVTLYEALTGSNPFAAPTVAETVRLIAKANVADPRDLRPRLPAGACEAPDHGVICGSLAAPAKRSRFHGSSTRDNGRRHLIPARGTMGLGAVTSEAPPSLPDPAHR